MTIDELREVMQSDRGDEAIAHAMHWNGEVEVDSY